MVAWPGQSGCRGAGVVLLETDRHDAWYAHVAAYLNLPATAFVGPTDSGCTLRWFGRPVNRGPY